MAEFIRFVDTGYAGKTKRWLVENKRAEQPIGTISWYGPWRQYCFYPLPNTVYSAGCLGDITEFCGRQTNDHRFANGRVGPKVPVESCM